MSFENRLGELLKDEDPYATGPDPVTIMAAARRRRARRRVGAGAAAVAVAVVCGVTAVTTGNARHAGQATGAAGAPSAGAAAPAAGAPAGTVPAGPVPTTVMPPTAVPVARPTGLPLSPVRRVAPKEKVELAPGVRLSVTPTQDCQDYIDRTTGAYAPTPGCTDVLSAPGIPYDRPGIATAYNETADRVIVHSYYRGPTPARIVLFTGDRPTVATLLTTAGMEGWVSYYGDVPRVSLRGGAALAVPAVGAYDSAGKLLAGNPGQAADGTREQPPATL
ncbi:hypothetical protein ACFWP2_06330 [Kitasatospora sp. NPDC058444]|uniref:hypothetical protein n=1 Tax=Kitasatospora sp. NPDC058444 TaxID=3346504 RepID=UPI0036582683